MKKILVGAVAVGAMALIPALAVGAPASAAAPQASQACQDIGNATLCSSPGNVQINDTPPVVTIDSFAGGFYGGPYAVPFTGGRR